MYKKVLLFSKKEENKELVLHSLIALVVRGGGAAASMARFYLSTNATFDASDIPLGGRGVGALAANGTESATTTLMMPAGTAVGTWYIIAVADGDAAVVETLETNNTRAVALTVK